MPDGDLYERLVAAANALYGIHPGMRALHTKGVWCDAVFTATADARELCRAAYLGGEPVPALVRFSSGGGRPDGSDAGREARGIAVKLRPPEGDEGDILAVTTPAFIVRTPEEFLELLEIRKPDPETGQPDMERLGAFLGTHPESQTAIQATLGSEPPKSFATLLYYSPHTYRLLDAEGNGTWVRWRWRPEAGEATIPDDEAKALGRDYLAAELADRLATGPAAFTLLAQLPAEEDPLDDPTALWPDDRRMVEMGRLEVTGVVPDPEGGDHIEVFDPMRLPDGIEPSDDPVLRARPKAYSVSAYHRLETAPPA